MVRDNPYGARITSHWRPLQFIKERVEEKMCAVSFDVNSIIIASLVIILIKLHSFFFFFFLSLGLPRMHAKINVLKYVGNVSLKPFHQMRIKCCEYWEILPTVLFASSGIDLLHLVIRCSN